MLTKIHRELEIPSSYSEGTDIPIYVEPDNLVSIGTDIFGRPQKLAKKAADKWQYMQSTASKDGVCLSVVSAFRSVDYQSSLINTAVPLTYHTKTN